MNMKDQDEVAAMRSDIKLLLSTVATKEDLKAFATKDDLTGSRRKLALEIVKTNGRIDQLREDIRGEMRIMSSGFHKKIDRFMSEVGKVDRAQIIADWRMTQIGKRVGVIESRPS